jgi:hypothetical protein
LDREKINELVNLTIFLNDSIYSFSVKRPVRNWPRKRCPGACLTIAVNLSLNTGFGDFEISLANACQAISRSQNPSIDFSAESLPSGSKKTEICGGLCGLV